MKMLNFMAREEKILKKNSCREFGLGIIPIDKSSFDVAQKNNLAAVYPQDGLCWVPEGVAIFKKQS